MRRFILYNILLLVLLPAIQGCMKSPEAYPEINSVTVNAIYPQGFEEYARAGVSVKVSNSLTGDEVTAVTGEGGKVTLNLNDGLYVISVSDRKGVHIFNGTVEKFSVDGNCSVDVRLEHSERGSLVFKEIYAGGCSMAPKEGTYQVDKYAIIHNNLDETFYLDSLCIGVVAPYNSTAVNRWTSKDADGAIVYPEYVPVAQAVWQIEGDGKKFPLKPGEDAIISFYGAIDHTVNVPLSVNLNRSDVFVCYNSTFFPNTTYHPAPGDKVQKDHILGVVVKTGIANAYTVSISSPALVIFKARGTSIEDFVKDSSHLLLTPGSSSDYVTAVPYSWIMDAVEVFDGRSTANAKRLSPTVDAGYVFQSDIYKGHTLFRKTDEAETSANGYEVLQDTNNSMNDFYERDTQSLHK